MKKKYNLKNQSKLQTYIYIYLFIIITLYLFIYYYYLYPLSRLHKLQTKDWIVKLNTNLLMGAKDNSYLYKERPSEIINKSFYYNYFFFHTEKYTLYTVFNLNNKFSNDMTMNVYFYNFENNNKEFSKIVLNFNDLHISKVQDTIIIQLGNSYIQKINMITNKMEITVNSPNIRYNFETDIDDYNTVCPFFIPRYKLLNNFVPTYIPTTNTPGEWCSDNGFIGKINKGYINNDIITNGNFWFDNFIGVNNHYLASNIWNVILNNDWLIYILWFGEYDSKDKTVVFIIKDRKKNKVFKCGFGNSVIPSTFKIMNIVNPIKSDHITNKPFGVNNYDDFFSYIQTDEINIKINSIKDESNLVYEYDYYSDRSNDYNINNEFDKKYINVLKNYKYAEYVNFVNVEIEYNNTVQTFKERCVIDGFFKKDKSMIEFV